MISRSSLPGMLMSAVVLAALGFLAPLGANKAVADPDETHPGCGTFCQNAGQYGAPAAPAKDAVTIISTGTITVEPDGYAPVTLKCNLQVQCEGALLLELSGWANPHDSMSWVTARSDLVVNAGATQTIGLAVPAGALAVLRAQGPTALAVLADTGHMVRSDSGVSQYTEGFNTLTRATLRLAAPG
jgi:hypothetical protein